MPKKRVFDSRNKVRGRTVATVVKDSAPVRKAEPLTPKQRSGNPLSWTVGPQFTPDIGISGLGAYRTDKKNRTLVTSSAVNFRDNPSSRGGTSKPKGPVTSL